MKTRRISALLAALMLAATVVTACGGNDNAATDTNNDTNAAAESTVDGESSEEAAIDMNEDSYEVAIQVVNLPGMQVENEEDIEAAINEITLPAINCTVDLQYVWISEIQSKTSLGVASNEKLDILHVATLNKLSSLVGQDILLDMNENDLLQTHGQKLIEAFGDYISAGEVDGRQLAIPSQIYMATQPACVYNKTITDALGIEVPEKGTMEDITKMIEEVHAGNSEIMGMYVGEAGGTLLPWMTNLEGFGTNYSYGAIVDFMNSTTIENLYATDTFKEYCLRMYDWRQKGILCKDSTDSNPVQDYFNAQKLLTTFASYTPSEKANTISDSKLNGFQAAYCLLDQPAVTNSSVSEFMWGIAVNSERPDKAMDFLNLLYSNADVANLIMYGIEYVDYTWAGDGIIERTGAYNPVFYKGGDTREMYIVTPNDDTYIDQCEALESEALVSPIIGYIFDDSEYQTESAVIANVLSKYLPILGNGIFESEEEVLATIDKFNEDLVASGINDVIAGNQEQLDAWLASK